MIKVQDGKEKVEIGCFPALWKLALLLIIVFNSGKIFDFISGILGGCK